MVCNTFSATSFFIHKKGLDVGIGFQVSTFGFHASAHHTTIPHAILNAMVLVFIR